MKHETEIPHVADLKMTVEGLIPSLGRGLYLLYFIAIALIVIIVPMICFLFVFSGEL